MGRAAALRQAGYPVATIILLMAPYCVLTGSAMVGALLILAAAMLLLALSRLTHALPRRRQTPRSLAPDH